MIPSNIERGHIIKAIREVDLNGVPHGRESRSFSFTFEGKRYPPKYVLSLANKFANGEELDPSRFSGGQETNNFLKRLEFEIVEISSRIRYKPKPFQNKTSERAKQGHDERCPECKKSIERMLKEIYGSVESNYKFEVSSNVENYKDFPFYQELKEIILELQKHRGHKDFVKTSTLPRCDFFVPNPGFIIEFDESQHFTLPRKIALQHYPEEIELGFDRVRWIALCEKINAKDNDPPYRDEQRAWYDTLRDFLPEFKCLEPTVRLYSGEMQWCSLNPEKTEDIAKFSELINVQRKNLNGWIATVILQSNSDKDYSSNERMKALSKIVDSISKGTSGDGVILFPCGWFNTDREQASTIYNCVEKKIKGILEKIEEHIIICVGIDGKVDDDGFSHDQIAIAISNKGIEAKARKFHPSNQEKEHVELANDYLSKEDGKSRIFKLNGVKYFMCVCYDSFGIRRENLLNPNVDIILNLVHCFYLPGKGPSGDTYFARHGFAGASKQWKCPVFGAGVFFNRKVPERWPSGVYWNKGDKSTQKWGYDDNPIKPKVEFEVSTKEGSALVRIYNL